MAFVDYTFYTTEYLGNVIGQADFPRMAMRASEKLDFITFGRIKVSGDNLKFVDGSLESTFDESVEKKIRKCTCAIAERIFDVEVASKTIRNSGVGVKSVSSGSESITFADNNTAVSEKVLNDTIFQIAKEYIGNTGLLYAGW